MRPRIALAAAAVLAVLPIAPAQSPRVEDVWHKETLHPVAARTLYRFATCPNGLTLITNTNGDLLAVDAQGVLQADRRIDELADVTASTCDSSGRFLVASEGWLRIFNVSEHADLELAAKHWIAGGPSRLMATPEGGLYVVGMAFQDGQHVFLRRFRLSDGQFLGVPQVQLPFKSAAGFNSFAVNGVLAWNRAKEEAVFAAANPAKLWRMKGDGSAHAVLPQAVAFRNAEVPPEDYGRRGWQDHDWIRNMAALPDGRIVAQVFRGRGNPPPDGESFAYFFVLNQDYETVTEKIPVEADEFSGLLSGADSDGNLYFVDLEVGSVAKVTKARLQP